MSTSIHNLEDLLAGPGRIGVLRALAEAERPLTGRQVAAVAGLSHAGATRVLTRLSGAGLVSRVSAGRAMLHELDRTNSVVVGLVLPLVDAERKLLRHDVATVDDTTPIAQRVNPRVHPYLAAIEDACRRHRVIAGALFGSATQTSGDVVPGDLDVLVTFAPLEPRMKAQEYAALSAELEAIMGMPVDVMVSTAIRNPYLSDEIERTKVVLYEAA